MTHSPTIKILALTVLIILCGVFPQSAPAQQAGSFNQSVPYQQAVPSFLDEVTNAIKNLVDPNVIGPWIDQMIARFSEFLDDFKQAVIEFQNTALNSIESGLDKLKSVNQKWTDLINSFPGLSQFTQAVEPSVNKLVQGLPKPRSPQAGDVPLQNLVGTPTEPT